MWTRRTLISLIVVLCTPPAGGEYGLELVGKDPYAGKPLFYAAYPTDYPADCARPARPTSHWHRWHRMTPSLWSAYRGVKLTRVTRRFRDFEADGEIQSLYGARRTFFAAEASRAHATSGRRSAKMTIGRTVAGRLPTVQFPIGGDSQQRHTDNWRWIKMDVFNATGRDVIVGINKVRALAETGFGPTFVLKPGANTLACKSAELEGYFYHRGPSGFSMSRVFLFVVGRQDDVLYFDNVRLEQEIGATLAAKGRLFDFGSGRDITGDRGRHGGVFPGWTGGAADTAYDRARGFGWANEAGKRKSITMFHRHTHALVNDWVSMYQPGATFRVDLPTGRYGVWMLGQVALMKTGLTVQGRDVTAEVTRRGPEKPEMVGYDVDLIKGDSGWVRYKRPRNFVEVEFDATVTDGKLQITFDPKGGSRRHGLGIYALVVYPAEVRAQAEKEIGYLNTVTLTEASESNHGLIQPVYMEARKYGGIHAEFLHPEKTPAMFDALAPTPAERARGYVLFRRPFSEPVYFDTVPRRPEANAVAAGMTFAACPGEFVPVTLSVYPLRDLKDGTLAVSDLGIGEVDVRVERHDARWVDMNHENGTPYLIVPYYQVRRKSVDLEAGLALRFCVDVHVAPEAKPGKHAGTLTFTVGGRPTVVPFSVEVLPFRTSSPDVFFAAPGQFHSLYLDYGFNTLKTDLATAKAKGLKGYLVAGNGREKLVAAVDDAFRKHIAEGVSGRGPRMFCTSILTAGHQWAKPNEEVVNALRKAAPKLDVLGTTDVLFWLTDFKHSRPRVMLNAGTLKANAGRFTWFCDAVQPSKELAARYTFGAWLWRAGINGRMSYADAWHPWVLGYETHGSAYPYGHSDWVIDWEHSNSPLIWGSSFAFFLDDPHGKPCPSRDFLNIREGITDYRVLHTLEDAVAAARKAGRPLDDAGAFLRTLRAEIPTDLRQTYGGWGPPDAGGENWYLKPDVRLRPGRLEEIRAEAVRHLVRLKGAHPR